LVANQREFSQVFMKERNWAASEAAVFYYALFAWRARPQSAPGARAFPLAQASGYGMFAILLMIAVIFEGVPLHLLLRNWSHAAAWIATAVGIYGFLWTLALYRSLSLRPVLIGGETVLLQVGFLWRAEFSRRQIREVRRFSAANTAGRKSASYLSLVVLNKPQWLVELNGPVTVAGPFGRRKSVTRIGVAVDDGDGFGAMLRNGAA
jgi:hypothetical protein